MPVFVSSILIYLLVLSSFFQQFCQSHSLCALVSYKRGHKLLVLWGGYSFIIGLQSISQLLQSKLAFNTAFNVLRYSQKIFSISLVIGCTAGFLNVTSNKISHVNEFRALKITDIQNPTSYLVSPFIISQPSLLKLQLFTQTS